MQAPPAPRVSRPVMYHHWDLISFLHWRYRPEVVEPLLPRGLRLETFDGSAWIGLIPFLMSGVRAPGVMPECPWARRCPSRPATSWPTS